MHAASPDAAGLAIGAGDEDLTNSSDRPNQATPVQDWAPRSRLGTPI
jgi:hypothetical protein